MRILVIEDEKLLAQSLKALLEAKGFQVETVYDGESGAEYAELGVYDLLILDVMMPGLDGYQVARQMRGLVENLLELARADTSAPEQQAPLDLSSLVSGAALPFEALFFERGLTLIEDVEEGITIKGNPAQLRQLVEIFLDNAQKYSDPGQAALRLRRKGRAHCLLSLSNPGAPIPQEELKNIFKRFYRLDKARSRDGSCGLGLSIAQSIANAHQGKIWAESGGGRNTFFVELPVL